MNPESSNKPDQNQLQGEIVPPDDTALPENLQPGDLQEDLQEDLSENLEDKALSEDQALFEDPEDSEDLEDRDAKSDRDLPENTPLPADTALAEDRGLSEDISFPDERSPIDTIYDEEAPLKEDEVLASIDFDLTEEGRWLLKVVSGPNNGAEFVMQPESTYILGTDTQGCDIVFHDTSVSRQHARIAIGNDDSIAIEDLNSRNGTMLDGEPLEGKQMLEANTLVSLGTTSFVIFDREGQMQTVISPFLPSIAKALRHQQEPAAIIHSPPPPEEPPAPPSPPSTVPSEPIEAPKGAKTSLPVSVLIFSGVLAGVVLLVGWATTALFTDTPPPIEAKLDAGDQLDAIFKQYPGVRFSFNKATGKLLVVGHVLTSMERNQLIYDLQGIKAIRSVDENGLIIDELVWQEANQILAKTPNWRGVNIHSPKAGSFVLSGYLQSREQADRLSDYISANFTYLDLLEKRIVVEEEVITAVGNALRNSGFKDIQVRMRDGELTLSGGVPLGKKGEFETLLESFQEIPGVRSVKNLVVNLAPEQSIINISDKYQVTGSSTQDGVNYNVVITGRILSQGDIVDGMKIERITPRTILLEKDGIKYRIDYH